MGLLNLLIIAMTEQAFANSKSTSKLNRQASSIIKNLLAKVKKKRQSLLPKSIISSIENKDEGLDLTINKRLFELTNEEKKRLVLKKGYAF